MLILSEGSITGHYLNIEDQRITMHTMRVATSKNADMAE